uniref:Uncharacterized protein n=1 Tax=Tetradesmus obliquus TaxID=3088 RepID=A0A383VCW2_TETOB|eukprot:jgi/Sobl393_1/17516/SZX62770.1
MVAAAFDHQHAGAGPPRASPVLLCCFYLLGMGVVCNWVALLQCQDYLGPLFTAYSPSRVLTAAYAALDLLAQSLLFFFGDRLWANKRSRMVVGYAACTAVTAALPLLDMYLLDTAAAALGPQAATAAYFGAWAGYSLVAGACSAIIGSVTYAQAAVYGPSYCQAFVRGRAASGLSCILVRVLTKATLPDSPAGLRQSTLLFLGAAAALLAACTAAASWLLKEAPGKAAAAAVSVGCTPTLAVVSTHDAWQPHPPGSTGACNANDLHEPLLLAADAAGQEEEQQLQGEGAMAVPSQQQLDAAAAAAATVVHPQQQEVEPHWCAVVDAVEASKHDSIPSSPAAAAAAALQELPRHLICRTMSSTLSLEDGISSAVHDAAASPEAAAAAASPAAAWEPFGWQPPSASVAAAAAAAGELSAFHGSFLETHSYASPDMQSPFSGFSSYWHSGQHASALPLLSQHAQHAQHMPSSVLWTPPGQSLSSFQQQQQQQQQLVAEGRSLASSCCAALRRMHCYVAAMAISFFVPCFIFPAMLSPEAGSWRAVGSWWTIMLVGAFQAGAVAGSALPLYSIQHPQRFISLLAWGQWAVVPATLAALALHGGPLALLGITFGSMVYGYHVASLVFWLACEGLGSAADVELVQGLLVLTLTAARLAGLLLSWLWG